MFCPLLAQRGREAAKSVAFHNFNEMPTIYEIFIFLPNSGDDAFGVQSLRPATKKMTCTTHVG